MPTLEEQLLAVSNKTQLMDRGKMKIEFMKRLHEEIRKYPFLLEKSTIAQSLEDQKGMCTKKMLVIHRIRKRLGNDCEMFFKDFYITLAAIDPSLYIKYIVAFDMFPSCISRLGTDQHQDYYRRCSTGEIIGGFSLTEISHGSNTKFIQTYAKYDKDSKEFVLNTPNFLAAKCWAANVGRCATHIILYAQLITPDETNHGLHAFIVDIRNPQTLLPYPGVTIGDMGEKSGLESIENGFIAFHEYRIPKGNLLNRLADVNKDGTYFSRISNPNIQFAISLGILSSGRVKILGLCGTYITSAMATAFAYRFAGNQDLLLIPGNQTQQIRLIPYIAVAYVCHIMHDYMYSIQERLLDPTEDEEIIPMGKEFHAILSGAKAILSWLARDGIKEYKEVLHSTGYLTVSELGNIYNSNDPNTTFEGDNYVLIQQTSNWLLQVWSAKLRGKTVDYPLLSVSYLNDAPRILNRKLAVTNLTDFVKPQNILGYYQWLTCYLINEEYSRFESLLRNGAKPVLMKSNCQIYHLKTMAEAYVLTFFIQRFYTTILETSGNTKLVLEKLLSLYGIWSLQRFMSYFYQGGYASGSQFAELQEDALLTLCKELENDCVSLVDTIAQTSGVGLFMPHPNGKIYNHLESTMTHSSNAFSKFKWNNEIGEWKKLVSKL